MAHVFLSVGSSIQREHHIRNALVALDRNFRICRISSVYESEAVGFEGDNFYNLVVEIETVENINVLANILKNIENANGRDRTATKFSARTLDIDILTYNDLVGEIGSITLPRKEIETNAFVLLPLAEIAEFDLHPQLRVAYGELWAAYDKSSQNLWAVPFDTSVRHKAVID